MKVETTNKNDSKYNSSQRVKDHKSEVSLDEPE